jgi:hypothetical protein
MQSFVGESRLMSRVLTGAQINQDVPPRTVLLKRIALTARLERKMRVSPAVATVSLAVSIRFASRE